MDRINKFLIILSFGGVFTLCIGCSYIPSPDVNVPQGESTEEYIRKGQLMIYNSSGFKATIVGAGIIILCVLIICCRSCISEYREANQIVKSVIKVAPEPIQVIIDDPKPLVKTLDNYSPPAQLVPSNLQPVQYKGPVIQKISKINNVRFANI